MKFKWLLARWFCSHDEIHSQWLGLIPTVNTCVRHQKFDYPLYLETVILQVILGSKLLWCIFKKLIQLVIIWVDRASILMFESIAGKFYASFCKFIINILCLQKIFSFPLLSIDCLPPYHTSVKLLSASPWGEIGN